MMYLMADEGFVFDYLAILQVKQYHMSGMTDHVDRCKANIKSQIGLSKFSEIYHSQEYKNLFDANMETFQAVEKARYGEISAKEVDDCNMKRYNAKVALQKKFFPSYEQVEKKS